MNIEHAFRNAMAQAGIMTDAPIIADGNLHRVHAEGDRRGTKNIWYTLHADGRAAGAFGHWRTGVSQTWRGESSSPPSDAQRAEFQRQQQQREAETQAVYTEAARRAEVLLSEATGNSSNHPYIRRKGIEPFGVKVSRTGSLVIPVYNAETHCLQSLQFVGGDGRKTFLTGGRMKAGCVPLQHSPESFKAALQARIAIAEGFATAATIAQALGPSTAVFAAFSADNLEAVAVALRARYPNAAITICGDNDLSGVGQRAAQRAALAVDGALAIPEMPGLDWNDVALQRNAGGGV